MPQSTTLEMDPSSHLYLVRTFPSRTSQPRQPVNEEHVSPGFADRHLLEAERASQENVAGIFSRDGERQFVDVKHVSGV